LTRIGTHFARKRYVTPIHIGSGDPAKGPRRAIPSRDFAVVMAQTSPARDDFRILSTYSIK
jgi:hypothetical protein